MLEASSQTTAHSSVAESTAPQRPVALSILLVAFISFNLRPLLTSVAPLIHDIQPNLSISNFWVSVLLTAPVMCLGIFGPLASPLVRRLGLEHVLLVAIAVALLGAVLRSFGLVPLFLGTVMVGAGISLLGILAPVLIKRDFPDKVGPMMGLFAMMLGLGAAISTGAAVPIKDALGGSWRASLSVWMAPLVITALIVTAMLRYGDSYGPVRRQPKFKIMNDPVTWQLMGFFALITSTAYAAFSWGPSMLTARGLDPQTSGLIMSVFYLAQMPSGLLTPIIAGRMRDQRLVTVSMVLMTTFGMIAFLFAPTSSLVGVAVLIGIGLGGGLPIGLTLIVLRAGTPQVAAKLSSVVQSVGYIVGGLAGPFAIGLLHDMTGGWSATAYFFAIVGAASAALGYGASKDRTIRVIPVHGS